MAGAHNGTLLSRQSDLERLLADFLKPLKVKQAIITRSDRYSVQGRVLVYCPVEKREAGKDFVVELSGDNFSSIVRVLVDGRTLYTVRSSKHRGKPPLSFSSGRVACLHLTAVFFSQKFCSS